MSNTDLPALGKKKKPGCRMWLRFDIYGNTEVLEVDKYAIMRRASIPARDLRILGPLMSNSSTILGREKAIVLNLEHIKAIITAEEVLLLNANSAAVIPFVEELRRRISLPATSPLREEAASPDRANGMQNHDSLPFEFRVMEVALEAVCSYLDARTQELEGDAYPALDELTAKVTVMNLDRVRGLKSRLTRLTARVQKVRDELEQLLDDDGDMDDMYLTRKMLNAQKEASRAGFTVAPDDEILNSPMVMSRASSRRASGALSQMESDSDSDSSDGKFDVEELEMLLESYFLQIDTSLNKLSTLNEFIDDTEDYINIELDNQRNILLTMQLMLTTATFVVGCYTVVVGVFGMNIPNKLYHKGSMFKWVVGSSIFGMFVIFFAVIAYAKRQNLIVM
ncbi:Magnesium transporters: CorA family [Klebsormidium nitens]|uniref:Magnesium transporter n=1 Tax=Klebsormidium nitens TaxID=105231 RepID=A0A1Y1IGA7_KLENI|nr:Magnesium transporters: CorA family [Klebsormidium nitens]|eukprot:GAQ88101.1 Magnesium transporters: CorA family [Klebsormidium nitens]